MTQTFPSLVWGIMSTTLTYDLQFLNGHATPLSARSISTYFIVVKKLRTRKLFLRVVLIDHTFIY